MLNEELIDIVNSGRAWGLVGSGASCMAGVPTWDALLAESKQKCLAASPGVRYDDAAFTRWAKKDIPRAFSYLADVFSRAAIEEATAPTSAGSRPPAMIETRSTKACPRCVLSPGDDSRT